MEIAYASISVSLIFTYTFILSHLHNLKCQQAKWLLWCLGLNMLVLMIQRQKFKVADFNQLLYYVLTYPRKFR